MIFKISSCCETERYLPPFPFGNLIISSALRHFFKPVCLCACVPDLLAMSFAFAQEAAAGVSYDEKGVFDSPIPGGGSMYLYRRVDVSGGPMLLALGCGTFATTMDCVRVLSGERLPVAIKQIALPKSAAEAAEKEEVRGLRALSGRSHPNIVRYFTSFRGEEGGGRVRISFVFERCPLAVPFPLLAVPSGSGAMVPTENVAQPPAAGCDLSNNALRKAPYTLREAVGIVRQVLHALAYLHASTPPIVHRDIKCVHHYLAAVAACCFTFSGVRASSNPHATSPCRIFSLCRPENILIWGAKKCERTGEQLFSVKITDFGTIRTAAKWEQDFTLGRGTLEFMAPEVEMAISSISEAAGGGGGGAARGSKPPPKALASYTTSIDVFSAGATLFYLVRPPW